jgi:uncharacterized protein with PQ loop repeat
MDIIDFIGWMGMVALVINSIPQAIKTFQTKSVEGLSLSMLYIKLLGCACMFLFILVRAQQIPLIINYLVNCLLTVYIIYLYRKYSKL